MTNKVDTAVIDALKSWNWGGIIHFGLNHVGKLKGKGSQYNWLRGDLIEDIIAAQDPTLEFVGQFHKDFNWHRFGISLESKSLLNNTMYDQKGRIKDFFTIKLCSVRGNRRLRAEEICDIILVVMKDGSFVIPKQAAEINVDQKGKQIDVTVSSKHIIEISGPRYLPKTISKIDINEKVKQFKKSLIEDAMKEYEQVINS
jgi:hypothetical protein